MQHKQHLLSASIAVHSANLGTDAAMNIMSIFAVVRRAEYHMRNSVGHKIVHTRVGGMLAWIKDEG